jgi:hypothetical protein
MPDITITRSAQAIGHPKSLHMLGVAVYQIQELSFRSQVALQVQKQNKNYPFSKIFFLHFRARGTQSVTGAAYNVLQGQQ